MAIQFHQIDVKYSPKNKRLLKTWVSESITREKLIPGALNVIFCSDEHLLGMNQDFLKHDYFTDIITFNYNVNEVVNGDLYISVDRVKDNAKRLGINFETETQRVIIHGVMHLCGYKDKKKEEQKMMRSKEDFYLKKLTKMLP